MGKKKGLHFDLVSDGRQWVAKGPGIRVEAPSLQALRHRLRKAVEEVHAADVEFETTLHVPDALHARIERNRKLRAEIWELRAELSQDTAEILDILRNELGASYDDAEGLLGVDAAHLVRTVKSHSSERVSGTRTKKARSVRGNDD